MGTDATPPLPPINKNNGKKKNDITLFDRIFGISKRQKKKEEAKNLLNFYDNFEQHLRKLLNATKSVL